MNKQVLIIEYSSIMRMFLREVFKRIGYDVIEASDGEQGLRLAKSHECSLIIADIVTTGLCGEDYFKELRNEGPGVPIVAMAHVFEREMSDGTAKKLDVDWVLHKPFLAKDVYEAVESIVSRNHG
jgi:two-component system, OmpR family, alkaline phosphatase synthesis response regulator PhoP